jgi:trehalose 6-phosphate phosphatase
MTVRRETLLSTVDENEVDLFLRSVAQSQSSALLLDYDGTLAPFSIDRKRALPYAGVTTLLQELVDNGRTRVVIISGRNAYEVGPLLGVKPCPEIWGSHGLQRLFPDGTSEMPEIAQDAMQALADAGRWLTYQGLQQMAEPKPGSIAVHWRGLDEAAAVKLRGRILLGWSPLAEQASLVLLEFDGGVELRVPDRDKSDAVRTILDEIGPDAPVAYLGDDATDEHAFETLEGRGLTVLVRPQRRNSAAQVWLKPPGALLEFLFRWLEACRTRELTASGNLR